MDWQSELAVRVYIEDTDVGGVVYHANYVRYLERGRTEMLRELGLEQRETLADGVAFVVHGMTLRFQRPALMDNLLTVTTRVGRLRAASVVFEQAVVLPSGDVACSAEVTVACVHRETLRACRLPAALTQALTGAKSPRPADQTAR